MITKSSGRAPDPPPPTAEAFTALVKECDPSMRGLAFRLLGSVDAMDDALQDAYLKAYRSFGSFRGDYYFEWEWS